MDSSASSNKIIWVVASVSRKNGSRAWSFYDTKKGAIDSVFGWTNGGGFFSEDGYYEYVVVESLTLNHPLALSTKQKRKWFKLEYDPKTNKTPIVPCREPSYWKRVVGFHSGVYPSYMASRRFGLVDQLLKAIGFEEKAGKYSFSHRAKYDSVPDLLRDMGFDKMAKEVESKRKAKARK